MVCTKFEAGNGYYFVIVMCIITEPDTLITDDVYICEELLANIASNSQSLSYFITLIGLTSIISVYHLCVRIN